MRRITRETLNYLFHIPESSGDEYGGMMRKEIAVENILDGNKNFAVNDLSEVIREILSRIKSYHKRIGAFRFYDIESNEKTLDYILSDVKASRLTLGPVAFNDAHDPLLTLYCKLAKNIAKSRLEKDWYRYCQKAFENLRISCLCVSKSRKKSIYNPLMWAHYAQHHTGIAVEYEIIPQNIQIMQDERSVCFLKPIQYKDKRIDVKEITLEESLILKSKVCEYENEYRIAYYSEKRLKRYVPFQCEIKSIYLGVNISSEKQRKILSDLKAIDIPIYRMIYNTTDALNLQRTEIKRK